MMRHNDKHPFGIFLLLPLILTVGCGGESATEGRVIPTRDTPEAPFNLATGGVGSTDVTLTWESIESLDQTFSIERMEDGSQEGIFEEIGTVENEETSFQDSELAPLTTYTYRVRAIRLLNTSPFSNEATVTTLNQVPIPPDGLTVESPSDLEVLLHWNDNSANEDGFIIYFKKNTETVYRSVAPSIPADDVEGTFKNLEPGNTYSFYVVAFNEEGHSAWSNVVEQTVEP